MDDLLHRAGDELREILGIDDDRPVSSAHTLLNSISYALPSDRLITWTSSKRDRHRLIPQEIRPAAWQE